MGLDLLPKRLTHHDMKGVLPRGMTHPSGTPCPFFPDDFPTGMMGTCCSLRGKVAAENLEALGEKALYDLMHVDLHEEQCLAAAKELRRAADRLEQRYQHQADKPKGMSQGGMINAETGEITPWPRPSFEEAIASIREAADWYEKVGRLGFGAHAWY